MVTQIDDERSANEHDSKVFDCPECGAHLQFRMEVAIKRVRLAETAPAGWSKGDSLSIPERQIVEECQASGVFGAYMAAFNASNLAAKPADPDRFFFRFLTHAVKKKTPQFAIRLCLPENERSGDLELWTHGLVSVVLADGEFRQFMPTELIKGDKTSMLTVDGGWIQNGEKIDLDMWIKTRFGYVKGRGIFFQALRRRSIGDFAKGAT